MHIWIRGTGCRPCVVRAGEYAEYIHSQGHSLKIPLDTASYKLYYVNYKIGLNLGPVCFLCKSRTPESGFLFPPSEYCPYDCEHCESLKCFCRCGSSPKACQMRCTVDFDMRVSSAICRILQCVPSFGFVSSVLRTNRATRASLMDNYATHKYPRVSEVQNPCLNELAMLRRRLLPSRHWF